MKNQSKVKMTTSLLVVLLVSCSSVFGQIGGWDPEEVEKADEAILTFKEKNDKLAPYFAESYGYVVFPSVGKGAIGLGAAFGRGVVYEQGEVIGEAKMTQITLGLQWGGQSYSEIVFFDNKATLESFKKGELEFSGQVSAVAITAGASADIAYEDGVAVYTVTKAGFMYEASLGGQKFKYLGGNDSDKAEQQGQE